MEVRRREMQKLQTAEMRFLRSVKDCTRQDKVRNADVWEEVGVFSANGRIRRRQVWLEHMEGMI
jgi:hypothetical protein